MHQQLQMAQTFIFGRRYLTEFHFGTAQFQLTRHFLHCRSATGIQHFLRVLRARIIHYARQALFPVEHVIAGHRHWRIGVQRAGFAVILYPQ
ncbi:hypothetical protein D3C86_1860760 [compost metagenome]